MIYGYITNQRSIKLQKSEMEYFAKENKAKIEEWVTETIKRTKKLPTRDISPLLQRMVKGDKIFVGALAHLGRELAQIMKVLNVCMSKKVQVLTIKESMVIGDASSFNSLEFAFGLSSGIQISLISERTKEALALKKAEGVILGRPKGRKSKKLRLDGKENEIQKFLNKAVPIAQIARILGVHRITMTDFIKKKSLKVVTCEDFEVKRKTKK